MTGRLPPLVSIVVPVFNVEAYLDDCLNSIRSQTYKNIEILLVEDCSLDASLSRVKTHLEDPRVKLLQHKQNRGLSAARNTGIESAAGSYIIFVDSDDVVAPDLVEVCVATMERDGLAVLLFGFTSFMDGDQIPHAPHCSQPASKSRRFNGTAYFEYPHFAWLKAIRADVLRERPLRFPEGQNYEDWPFHWLLGFLVDNIGYIDRSLIFYRLRKNSITGAGDRKLFHILSANLLVAQIFQTHSSDAEIRRVLSEKLNRGAWYVIKKVESRFLGEAVQETKEYLHLTRVVRSPDGVRLKYRLLKILLDLPTPLAIRGLAAMRLIMCKLAFFRQRLLGKLPSAN